MNDKYSKDGLELWRKFAGSGKIADYMNYRSAAHNDSGESAPQSGAGE